MRITNFLSGALFGGVVGAVAAILLAPSSGDELRADMKARADRIRDDVEAAAASRRAELERQLAELRAPQKAE
jgi:gas vesicle protein